MGWFDEQILQRKKDDEDILAEALHDITDAVSGTKTFFQNGNAKNEITKILDYYGVKTGDLPGSLTEIDSQIEHLMRPHGIMKRVVRLKEGWHKDVAYPMLAKTKEGVLTALIPGKLSGYFYADEKTGRLTKVSKKTEKMFEEEAYCFYKPYSLNSMDENELTRSILGAISIFDIYWLVVASVLIIAMSLVVPAVYRVLFSHVTSQATYKPLFFAAWVLICIAISVNLITVTKKLLVGLIRNKLEVSCESAVMMRILSLPTSFFKKYSAGELSSKVRTVTELCTALSESVISFGITLGLSSLNFIWIALFVPELLVPALITTSLIAIFSVTIIFLISKINEKRDLLEADEQGITYSLICGISKIKLVGAEKRTFAKWGKKYAEKARAIYNPPFLVKFRKSIYVLITLVGSAWIYYAAAKVSVSTADFYAFTACYGAVTASMALLFENCEKIAQIKPKIQNIAIFFETDSEIARGKQIVTHLSGGIEMNMVTFKYSESKTIFNNLSLKIKPGEYVGVVGKTGCGKSTLIRLLLGFEMPQKGAIYYDSKALTKLDLKSLRQKIGIVMQNGKLFSGSIFSNIAITSTNLTREQAWEAAQMAGIADEIRNMPMGMNTIVSDDGGGLSGGQRQRILIARALAAKPRIMIFDEATSALDNITQKLVTDTLENIKCTRIIVAHRLSTIQKCTRIIVLDDGKIAEDGTYDELLKKGGLFAEIVARQMYSDV